MPRQLALATPISKTDITGATTSYTAVRVESACLHVPSKKLRVEYELLSAGGAVADRGTVELAFGALPLGFRNDLKSVLDRCLNRLVADGKCGAGTVGDE